jgi:hypothetical protein
VIEIEATREVLLRLAAAGVLYGEDAGYHLEEPFGAKAGTQGKLVLVGGGIGRGVAFGGRTDWNEVAVGED